MFLFTKLKIKNLKFKKAKAFTLIEILVAVGIFIATIIVLSQIYITVIRSERVAFALLNSENNVRNSLEVVARSVRLGKNFDNLPESGAEELCFDYYTEEAWQNTCYLFNEGKLEKSSGGGLYISMLDPQIKVNYGRFYIKGDASNSQKTIIVVLEVSTKIKNQEYIFNLETAVTPRYLGEGS